MRAAAASGFVLTALSTSAAAFGLVDVTVGNLLFSRSADILNGYIEIQVLARQRVIAIYGDLLVPDLNNPYRYRALLSAGLKLHTDFDIFDALKAFFRDDLLQCRVFLAVALFRAHANLDLITRGLPREFIFQTRNDILMPVQVSKRLPGL